MTSNNRSSWMKNKKIKLAIELILLYNTKRLLFRRVGQEVKTLPSHGRITGSSPVHATTVTFNKTRTAQPEN